MEIQTLQLDQADARYDTEQKIAIINYHGALGDHIAIDVYTWLDDVISIVGIDNMRGEIFNFQDVEDFGLTNLMLARQKSKSINIRKDTSRIPIALVVKNVYQEEILRGPMQVSPDNKRKKIVHSEKEAIDFINNWHNSLMEKTMIRRPADFAKQIAEIRAILDAQKHAQQKKNQKDTTS